MSRGSFRTQENIYSVDDPRYGMTPSEVEAYNRTKEFQEGQEERRAAEVEAEIERDIAAGIARRTADGVEYADSEGRYLSDIIREDPFYDFTDEERKELKNLERSGIFEGDFGGATTYYDKVRAFKEGARPVEPISRDELIEQDRKSQYKRLSAFDSNYSVADDIYTQKAVADYYYTESLKRSLANATTEKDRQEIQSLIDAGPRDFSTMSDYVHAQDLNSIPKKERTFIEQAEADALLIQSDTMGHYITKVEPDKYGQDISGDFATYYNTGSNYGNPLKYHFDASNDYSYYVPDNFQMGQLGGKQGYYTGHVIEPSPLVSVGLDILSFVYPPAAPVFQATKALFAGAEFEDAVKTGVKTYVGGEITQSVSNDIFNALDDANITLPDLPEPVKQSLVDTTAGIILGQDPEEALTNSIKRQATEYATDWAAGEIESVTGDFGQDLKEFLNLPEDYEIPESIQNIIDEGTEALVEGESATDAMESAAKGEIGDIAKEIAVDATGELLAGAGDLLEGADELFGDGLAAFDDTVIQPIIKPIKPALTAVGDVVEGGAKAVEGVVKDVIIDPAEAVVSAIGDTPLVKDIEEAVGSAVDFVDENIIDPADEVIDTIGDSDIVEAIEEGGKKAGELGQDIIDTGSDITSEIEDVVKATGGAVDDVVDWEDLLKKLIGIPSLTLNMTKTPSTGMLNQPTQVEEIFDDELFKFDTKIKRGERGMFAPVKINRRYG